MKRFMKRSLTTVITATFLCSPLAVGVASADPAVPEYVPKTTKSLTAKVNLSDQNSVSAYNKALESAKDIVKKGEEILGWDGDVKEVKDLKSNSMPLVTERELRTKTGTFKKGDYYNPATGVKTRSDDDTAKTDTINWFSVSAIAMELGIKDAGDTENGGQPKIEVPNGRDRKIGPRDDLNPRENASRIVFERNTRKAAKWKPSNVFSNLTDDGVTGDLKAGNNTKYYDYVKQALVIWASQGKFKSFTELSAKKPLVVKKAPPKPDVVSETPLGKAVKLEDKSKLTYSSDGKKVLPAQEVWTQSASVTGDEWTVRDKPSTKGKDLGRVHKGDKITLIGTLTSESAKNPEMWLASQSDVSMLGLTLNLSDGYCYKMNDNSSTERMWHEWVRIKVPGTEKIGYIAIPAIYGSDVQKDLKQKDKESGVTAKC